MTPRVPEKGALSQTAGGPGPPTGSRTPIYYPDPSAWREQTPRLGQVRSRHVFAGAGTRASLPLKDSHTHRIQCGWLRRALTPQNAGQSLSGLTIHRILPRNTVQPQAQRPHRARLAALNRYDGTALSIMSPTPQATRPVQLRGRLRLAPFRQDRAKNAGRKIPADKPGKSEDEISFACSAIMYEQYVILYYIIVPTCRGPSSHVRRKTSLEI